MKTFAIYGTIIDTEEERTAVEDLTPAQFRAFVSKLNPKEELEIEINSPGGSVYGGIAIANMIRRLSANGHKVTAIVEGLAASIASVIMCACDKIVLRESSLVMIHNCWTTVQGDSNKIRKEAETMDKMNDAILSFYRAKFDLDDETLRSMMDKETWFSGNEADGFGFRCEVIPDDNGYSIAAKLKDIDFNKFKNAPRNLMEKICMKKLDEEKKVEKELEEEEKEVVKETEEKTEEEKETEKPDNEEVTEKETEEKEEVTEEKEVTEEEESEETVEEEGEKEEEDEDEKKSKNMVTKAECEKRVSGMQSTMAKKIDEMRKSYEAKISEFEIKAKAMSEELDKVKAESINLKTNLEKTEKELSETISAFEEKKTALDALNARVNTPDMNPENKPWKKLHGEALLKWCRENQVR